LAATRSCSGRIGACDAPKFDSSAVIDIEPLDREDRRLGGSCWKIGVGTLQPGLSLRLGPGSKAGRQSSRPAASQKSLEQFVQTAANFEQLAQNLVETVLEGAARDNATIVVVSVLDSPRPPT
jgi:hypothetical protein